MNNRRDEIYDSITKKQIGILLAAGGLIGAVIFIICYGFAVLDVTNDGWLLKGGDLMQHYVGWKAYRQSPWQFPIGMTEGLIYPDETCVIYTDSIPLFAIFFKLLSPLLPETFQYFGLWGIMSFILMGGISAVILRKGTDKLYLCVAVFQTAFTTASRNLSIFRFMGNYELYINGRYIGGDTAKRYG